MADPRKTVLNDGVDPRRRTYHIDNSTITYDRTKTGGSAQVGLAVTFSGDDTVALADDGDAIAGKLLLVESDDIGVVQIGGNVTLPAGTGASVTRGKKIVGDLLVAEKGYIREVATGTAAELGKARGFIANNADAAAIVVELE